MLIKYIKSALWRVVKRLSYIEDARCLKVNVCRIFLSSCTLRNTLFLMHRSKLSSPSLSNTKFQNFQSISDLLSEMSKFQYQTKLCSKCSILLVFYLNVIPLCWWKEPPSWWMLFCHDNPRFNFTCTSWVICYPICQKLCQTILTLPEIIKWFW